jgi:hypothetical protein
LSHSGVDSGAHAVTFAVTSTHATGEPPSAPTSPDSPPSPASPSVAPLSAGPVLLEELELLAVVPGELEVLAPVPVELDVPADVEVLPPLDAAEFAPGGGLLPPLLLQAAAVAHAASIAVTPIRVQERAFIALSSTGRPPPPDRSLRARGACEARRERRRPRAAIKRVGPMVGLSSGLTNEPSGTSGRSGAL